MNEDYSKDYNEKGFFEKILSNVQWIGEELLDNVLVLFYLLQEDAVPVHIKATIVGALGYFITPLDLIPDLAPAVGYTDDAAAVAGAFALAALYITPEVKQKARNKVDDILHR